MTDEPLESTPAEETIEPVVDETPTPDTNVPAEPVSTDNVSQADAPVVDDTPVEIVAPVVEPDDVSPDPPEDPIITDPVLTDVPVDSVFDVPLQLLDTAAVAVLADMPDEDKTALQAVISTDYWGEYEHFQCTMPNCQKDFLSEAAMVSHVATEHQPADVDTPVGSVVIRDRFNNLVGYEEI